MIDIDKIFEDFEDTEFDENFDLGDVVRFNGRLTYWNDTKWVLV